MQQASEFIDDPNDSLQPSEFQGQLRFLIDPDDFKPDDWDSEDDGTWEPNLIPNPSYEWKRRQIRNPNYQPPPTFWNTLWAEIHMAIPWVTLGVLVTGVATSSLSLQPYRYLFEQWKKFFQNSTLVAALLGLATPLCSCGALPVALGFWNEGIPPSAVVAFLTASQSAGIDSAAITYGLLGPTAVFSRLLGALILAMAAGRCLTTPPKAVAETKQSPLNPSASNESGLRLLLVTVVDTAVEVFPTVLFGLTLSTLVVHFFPSAMNPIMSNEGLPPLASFLFRWSILVSALPLQLCEHTTVAIAAAIQKAGGSPGLAFGFLLSAPATNLPTLLLLTKKMSTATTDQAILLLRMGVVISGTALAFSYLIDFLEMDLLVQEEAKSSSAMASLPEAYVSISPWLASSLFLSGLLRSLLTYFSSRKQSHRVGVGQDTKECCNTCPSGEVQHEDKKND
jgi:hypothetical protein